MAFIVKSFFEKLSNTVNVPIKIPKKRITKKNIIKTINDINS